MSIGAKTAEPNLLHDKLNVCMVPLTFQVKLVR